MATPKAGKSKSGRRSLSSRAGLIMPVGRIGSLLRRGRYAGRVSVSAAAYLAATLEFLSSELLSTAAKASAGLKKKTKRISPRAITLGVRNDAELGTLLRHVTLAHGGVLPNVQKAAEKKRAKKKRAKKVAHRGSQKA